MFHKSYITYLNFPAMLFHILLHFAKDTALFQDSIIIKPAHAKTKHLSPETLDISEKPPVAFDRKFYLTKNNIDTAPASNLFKKKEQIVFLKSGGKMITRTTENTVDDVGNYYFLPIGNEHFLIINNGKCMKVEKNDVKAVICPDKMHDDFKDFEWILEIKESEEEIKKCEILKKKANKKEKATEQDIDKEDDKNKDKDKNMEKDKVETQKDEPKETNQEPQKDKGGAQKDKTKENDDEPPKESPRNDNNANNNDEMTDEVKPRSKRNAIDEQAKRKINNPHRDDDFYNEESEYRERKNDKLNHRRRSPRYEDDNSENYENNNQRENHRRRPETRNKNREPDYIDDKDSYSENRIGNDNPRKPENRTNDKQDEDQTTSADKNGSTTENLEAKLKELIKLINEEKEKNKNLLVNNNEENNSGNKKPEQGTNNLLNNAPEDKNIGVNNQNTDNYNIYNDLYNIIADFDRYKQTKQ